jgi:hypothetical protein
MVVGITAGKKDPGKGLEAQSKDGIPDMLAKSLEGSKEIKSVAVFTTPPSVPALPARSLQAQFMRVAISAMPEDRLTLTTMMGQSNDWFYGPGESGIELFKDGNHQRRYQLANHSLGCGTEVDREPGIGTNQGPRQKAPDTGKAENGVVRKIEDGKAYSKASDVMRVTIKPAH